MYTYKNHKTLNRFYGKNPRKQCNMLSSAMLLIHHLHNRTLKLHILKHLPIFYEFINIAIKGNRSSSNMQSFM